MNSKQRRKARRAKRFRGIEGTVEELTTKDINHIYDLDIINDFCPNMYDCKNAQFEFRCFGKYEECPRYKTNDLTLSINGYERGK